MIHHPVVRAPVKGDRVAVYVDPLTCHRLEGYAFVWLVLFHDTELGWRCEVAFERDTEGQKYERWVFPL